MAGLFVMKRHKTSVAEAKAGRVRIRLHGYPEDRVHQFIEQASMRDDQKAADRAPQQLMQASTGTQEQFPVALAVLAEWFIGRPEFRLRIACMDLLHRQ